MPRVSNLLYIVAQAYSVGSVVRRHTRILSCWMLQDATFRFVCRQARWESFFPFLNRGSSCISEPSKVGVLREEGMDIEESNQFTRVD